MTRLTNAFSKNLESFKAVAVKEYFQGQTGWQGKVEVASTVKGIMQKAKPKRLGRPPLPKGTVRERITAIRLQGDEHTPFERAAQQQGLKPIGMDTRKTLRDSLKK